MTKMRKTLGLGLVAAAALAFAGSAQAVPYEGLAFNSLDWNFSFSRIADEASDLPSGGIQLEPPSLANIGQAKYDVSGTSIDGTGGLTGGTITFSTGSQAMTFGSHSLLITGGQLNIEKLWGSVPEVELPFGFGEVRPDYELSGSITMQVNGIDVTFTVCGEHSNGNPCQTSPLEDDRPYENSQPYNTLNVGDEGGETDLAMFLYMKADCGEDEYPFYEAATTDRYFEKEIVGYEPCSWGSDCKKRSGDGISGKSKPVYEWVQTSYCKTWKDDCYKEEGRSANKDVYMKLALWGQGVVDERETPVAEPATLSLLGLGLIGLAAVRRRRHAT